MKCKTAISESVSSSMKYPAVGIQPENATINTRLLSADQMCERYGIFYEQVEKVSLRRRKVPPELWGLIPYAQLWGVGDDIFREQRVANAPSIAVRDLVSAVEGFEDLLDDWLAGDEAHDPDPSDEYVAYTAMRMAADFASA